MLKMEIYTCIPVEMDASYSPFLILFLTRVLTFFFDE